MSLDGIAQSGGQAGSAQAVAQRAGAVHAARAIQQRFPLNDDPKISGRAGQSRSRAAQTERDRSDSQAEGAGIDGFDASQGQQQSLSAFLAQSLAQGQGQDSAFTQAAQTAGQAKFGAAAYEKAASNGAAKTDPIADILPPGQSLLSSGRAVDLAI
jgi:predicted phage gp36 major capsid-like protein